MVEYWLEIVLGLVGIVIGLAISYVATPDTAIIVGVLVPIMAISVAMLKMSIVKSIAKVQSSTLNIAASSREIVEKMTDMNGVSFHYAKRHLDGFLGQIREIHAGKIFLTMPEYFNITLSCINAHNKGDTIYAINSKSGARWRDDPRQRKYKEANFSAAGRGVTINRIFIVSKKEIGSESFRELEQVIREHIKMNNINTHLVTHEMLESTEIIHESDWVYMERPFRQVLVDYTDSKDPMRGSHAYILTKDDDIDRRLRYFQELVRLSEEKENLLSTI